MKASMASSSPQDSTAALSFSGLEKIARLTWPKDANFRISTSTETLTTESLPWDRQPSFRSFTTRVGKVESLRALLTSSAFLLFSKIFSKTFFDRLSRFDRLVPFHTFGVDAYGRRRRRQPERPASGAHGLGRNEL